MTRTDSLVVGTLVALLALIASLVSVPSLLPTAASSSGPGASAAPPSRPYREGVLGRPVSVSPLSARTQADRDLVALVYAGLVRNGPSGSLVPDLAERWTVDSTGAVWTFYLRDDARWHDGEPVTAEDVAFTIGVLQDPKYHGPGAGSWNEVTVATQGTLTVVFTLKTPLGGFLQAATQPIAPAHILAGIPVDQLADRPFGRQPIGSGPFAVASLEQRHGRAHPGQHDPPARCPQRRDDARGDRLARHPRPGQSAGAAGAYLNGMEFRFFDDPAKLAAAYREGSLDAASGLPPGVTRDLGTADDSRVLRYPGATLTAVLLNLRPGHPEFADPAVRTALLAAIDRPEIVTDAFVDPKTEARIYENMFREFSDKAMVSALSPPAPPEPLRLRLRAERRPPRGRRQFPGSPQAAAHRSPNSGGTSTTRYFLAVSLRRRFEEIRRRRERLQANGS